MKPFGGDKLADHGANDAFIHTLSIAPKFQPYQRPLIALATSMATITAPAQASTNWRRVGFTPIR